MEPTKTTLTQAILKQGTTSGGPQKVNSPRPKLAPLSGKELYAKICIFGDSGTGKTKSIYDILTTLKDGEEIFVLETDIGGTGLETVMNLCHDNNRTDLLDRIFPITLNNYNEVDSFLRDPEKTVSDFWEHNFAWHVWEGFAMFHQLDIGEYVGEDLGVTRAEGKKVEDAAVEEGLKLERSQWGTVRNATLRSLDKFLQMHPKNRLVNKLVTMHEGTKSKSSGNNTSEIVESHAPAMQGASSVLSRGGFSIIIRCVKQQTGPNSPPAYKYQLSGHENLVAKNRGYPINPVEPADMAALWAKIEPRLKVLKK